MTDEQELVTELRQEITDLRDAIRLIIGRELGVPWPKVPMWQVDSYVDAIRSLKTKQMKAPAE